MVKKTRQRKSQIWPGKIELRLGRSVGTSEDVNYGVGAWISIRMMRRVRGRPNPCSVESKPTTCPPEEHIEWLGDSRGVFL